jgi:hypothetical protein
MTRVAIPNHKMMIHVDGSLCRRSVQHKSIGKSGYIPLLNKHLAHTPDRSPPVTLCTSASIRSALSGQAGFMSFQALVQPFLSKRSQRRWQHKTLSNVWWATMPWPPMVCSAAVNHSLLWAFQRICDPDVRYAPGTCDPDQYS